MAYVTNVPVDEDIWPELTALMIGQPWTEFYRDHVTTDFSQVIKTCFGHFCALYAYYIHSQISASTASHLSTLRLTYSDILDDLYTKYGNPNSRRTKFPLIYSKAGFGLEAFIEWLAYTAPDITDADQEIYDWYPATTKSKWNNKLGNPKTYPGWTLVMGQTKSPNNKVFGPYINYVYGAGNKNAISQNILLKDGRTIILAYAKYSDPPGWRCIPYVSAVVGNGPIPKSSFEDWKEMPYVSPWQALKGGLIDMPYFNIRDAKDPMYFSFNSSGAKTNNKYKTINYDIRYLDLL